MFFLYLLKKIKSLNCYLRGFLYHLLAFPDARRLRVGRGCAFYGRLVLGKNIAIGDHCTFETNVKIGNHTQIGNNVGIYNYRETNCSIGEHCTINRNTLVIGHVFIGDDCRIAGNTTIVGANHVFSSLEQLIREQGVQSKGIIIENNVWIGTQVTILDGVHIGSGAVVGAGAVVTKDVPVNAVVVGNPARIIRYRNKELS